MSDFLTADELARRLNLKASTIRRWAQDGIIPCLKLSAKVIRFDPEEVERALRERAAGKRVPA